MQYGKIEDVTLYSHELNEEMQVLIHLPHHYTPLYTYSVLFASDGKDYFQLGRIGRVVDELLDEGEIENTIVVGIPYKNVAERRRLYHPEGDRHQAYIRFLAHELVPYIDEQFPTDPVSGGRALIGDSLAASISLLTALKYPSIFSKVALHSPYVDNSVMEAVKAVKNPSQLSIYHVIGKGETAVRTSADGILNFIAPNRTLSELIQSKGIPYFYEEFDGDHTWKYWQPDVRRAVQMLFGQ